MKRSDIEYILRKLGTDTSKMKRSGDWYMVSCPLAPWTHSKGTDLNPSFGVREGTGISGVNCFSCGYKGGMMGLVREYARYALPEGRITEEEIQQLVDYVIIAEDEEVEVGTTVRIGPAPVSQELKDCLGVYHPYFKERGIPEEIARAWQLGYVEKFFDPNTMESMNDRVLFPIFENMGARLELRGVTGRALGDDAKKYKNSPKDFKKADYLYGEWLRPEKARKIIVVEGPIDVIKVSMHLLDNYDKYGLDYWVVGLMGAHPSSTQTKKLIEMAEEVIIMTDNDPSGKLGKKHLIEALSSSVAVSAVAWAEYMKDPDDAADALGELIDGRKFVLEDKLAKLLKY